MKKSILLLISLTLFLFNCKKKSKDNDPLSNNTSLRTKFKDTLVLQSSNNYNNVFASYCSFSDEFFVVQKKSGALYNFYNCDLEINNIVSKTINLGSDSLLEIKASKKNNSFYTLTATNNFLSSAPIYINAYVLNNYINDSTNHCTPKMPDYVFNDAFDISRGISGVNNSILNKFDGSGNLIWTKQLDGNYFDGHALETDQNGNVYVLTASKYPLTPKLSSAYSSTLVPYYELITDSNSFSLYKFDENGNQEYKKTQSNIKNNYAYSFNPSLAISKTMVTIANTDNLFIFDLEGNLLSQSKPIVNSCYNYINSIISNPNIDHTFVNGTIRYSNYVSFSNISGYFALYNATIPVVVSQSNNLTYNFSVVDNLENIYLGGFNKVVKKLDPNGTIIYTNFFINESELNLTGKSSVTDKNNALYSFSNALDRIVVYKFDTNGNFN